VSILCTTGAFVVRDTNGENQIFAFKTSDSVWTGFWHSQVHEETGFDSLSYGLIPQQGINAGMNETGLAVISSFFDYTSEALPSNSSWQGDIRGKVQAEVLSKYTSTEEALHHFQSQFEGSIAPIGGNHILVDSSGKIRVFEHCRGETAVEVVDQQVIRSNQAMYLFTEEQKSQCNEIQEDREKRLEQAEAVIKKLVHNPQNVENVLHQLQQLLSSHVGIGNELGSICAHGISKGRSNTEEPHFTMSAMIWHINQRTMYYTEGNPCVNEWEIKEFIK